MKRFLMNSDWNSLCKGKQQIALGILLSKCPILGAEMPPKKENQVCVKYLF